jgi:hypothetical protein
MSYRDLRRALLLKLKITPQALSERVVRRKKKVPMTPADATCLIAHEEGIPIDRYLPPEDLSRIRSLAASGGSQVSIPVPRRKSNAKGVGRPVEIRFPTFKLKDPFLPAGKLEEARRMAAIYPVLYVLENSIREVIKRVMRKKYGEAWWETELTAGKAKGVYQTSKDRQAKEKTTNAWHQTRGAHPIDYVDLGQLLTLIQAKQADFVPDVISEMDWFSQFMKQLEPSRNVLCHMNSLDKLNERAVVDALERWTRMLNVNRNNIP